MLPSQWDKQISAKKRKTDFMKPHDNTMSGAVSVEFSSDLHHMVSRSLHEECTAHDTDDLDLVHLLSKTGYKEMLENLFHESAVNAPDVPILSKVYEEGLMRPVQFTGEQACVMGADCECLFIDKKNGFVGVELRFHHDPPGPQMCVLCSRKTTQKMFYDMCLTGGGGVRGVIQRYGNIFNQPNEYATECMLSCPASGHLHCMPVPVMSHQRNKYTVDTKGHTRCLHQHRVRPMDFVTPSTTQTNQ